MFEQEHYNAQDFFLRYFNTDKLYKSFEKAEYAFLHYIKICQNSSLCKDRVYLSQIAEFMQVHVADISKGIKSLQEKGYLIWKTDEKQERTYVVLTDKAINQLVSEEQRIQGIFDKICMTVDDDDLATTICTLKKITHIINDSNSNK